MTRTAMRRHALGWTLAAGLTLLSGAATAQPLIQMQPGGTVSVHASGVSLGALLREMGALAPFERFVVGPAADSRLVTLALDGVPVSVAIVEMLKASDVDYVLVGSSGGAVPFRLVADVLDVAERGAVPGLAASAPPVVVAAGGDDDAAAAAQRAAAAQATAAQTDQATRAMAQALAPPAVPPTPGAPVPLPFPGASGAPLEQPLVPTGVGALPFPADMLRPTASPAAPAVKPPPFPPPPVDR